MDPVTLESWLCGLEEAPGVRPLERVGAAAGAVRRAAYRRRLPPGQLTPRPSEQRIVTLVEEAGVLRWREGVRGALMQPRRAGLRAALPSGRVVKQFAMQQLPASEVNQALLELDARLTPSARYAASPPEITGLRRWRGGRFEPLADPRLAAGKKVLLFIHGTFSNCESLVTQGLCRIPEGSQLLAAAEKEYDLVLAFDHPTLSVSPVMNAFDLAAQLRPSPSRMDIVCHSRGGLVTRWFCEAFADPRLRRRALLVASPVAGTSFAVAANLPRSLNLLTNVANVLRMGSLFIAASGLMRVLTSVIGNTHSVDAAIALIPGLKAQSRVSNNPELLRLQENTGDVDYSKGAIQYAAVTGDFEPVDSGWGFLRWFTQPRQQVADLVTDLVFPGSNDLVVDTESMTVAGRAPVPVAHHFKPGSGVHHVNYFIQPGTVAAIRSTFGF